jgi:Domain of unknown function (DUF4386)
MFRFSDSRNFARTLAAVALIAAPLCMALGTLIDPAWTDDNAEYLSEVAANEGSYLVSGALWTLGALLLVAGLLGVMRLVRGRRVTLGQVGVGLLIFGAIGMSAGLAFNGFEIAMAGEENREAMVTLSENLEDSAALGIYWIGFFFVGIVLGTLLLGISLFRSKIVPIWSPILLVVAIVLGFVGGDAKVINALSFIALAAGFLPLAQRMWATADDDWERWELPPAERRPEEMPAGAVGPSPGTP